MACTDDMRGLMTHSMDMGRTLGAASALQICKDKQEAPTKG